MAAASFVDVCRFLPTLGGTTDWVYSSVITGYQSPALAGALNATTYRYRAESTDLSQWEVGTGTYTVGSLTLARTTVLYNSAGTGTGTGQSGAGTKINFSTVPQVAIVALAEDLSLMLQAVRVTKYSASGTHTADAHLLYATIECMGGGGGGAGCINNATGQGGGGGGGAGSYSRKTVSAATFGASQTVTIGAAGSAGAATTPWTGGAGGDTSVGSLCIGKGGSGGGSNSGFSGTGGAGGVAGTGDLTGVGEAGGSGVSTAVNTLSIPSAFGGSTMFGGGGTETVGNATTSGTGATGFGSGGGGGNSFNNGGAAIGGTGAQGVVIVTEYCSQ